MNKKIEEIVDLYKSIDKEKIYQGHNIDILKEFKSTIKKNEKTLKEVLHNDNKEWGYIYSIEKLLEVLDKDISNEKISNKEELVVSIGSVFVISNGDPYITIDLIKKALISNSAIVFVNGYEMYSINETIINLAGKILQKYNLDRKLIHIIDLPNYKDLTDYIEYIDCIIAVKDYDIYTYFSNETSCKVIYSDYGNLNIYTDCDDFEDDIKYIIDDARLENKDAYIYKIDSIKDFFKYETNNFVFNTVAIYTKNADECVEFFKKIKSRNVYINLNPLKYTDIDVDVNEFLYTKKVIFK